MIERMARGASTWLGRYGSTEDAAGPADCQALVMMRQAPRGGVVGYETGAAVAALLVCRFVPESVGRTHLDEAIYGLITNLCEDGTSAIAGEFVAS